MKFVHSILRNSSTKIVDSIPVECASCHSPRLKRVPRIVLDRRFGIARRYECGKCYKFTLMSNTGVEECDENTRSSQLNDNEKSLVDLESNELIETLSELRESLLKSDQVINGLQRQNAELSAKVLEFETLYNEGQSEKEELGAIRDRLRAQARVLERSLRTKDKEIDLMLLKPMQCSDDEHSGEQAEPVFADALYKMGMMYALGKAVKKDDMCSLMCFTQSAVRGHASAQYNTALCLLKGIGSARDPARGRIWLRRAAKQNHEKAQRLLEKLETPKPSSRVTR